MAYCSFTQRDVDEGRVWYLHSGELVGDDGTSDHLLFSVTDSSHPPNVLDDQAFIIQVDAAELGFDVSSAPSTHLTATVSFCYNVAMMFSVAYLQERKKFFFVCICLIAVKISQNTKRLLPPKR